MKESHYNMLWRVGRDWEPWERSEAGGVNDDERHLHHSLGLESPRRSSGRIKGGATTVQEERGPGLDFSLCFVCGSRPWGAAALLLSLFILLLNLFECSPVPASFFPFYELRYTCKMQKHWTQLWGTIVQQQASQQKNKLQGWSR